MRITIKDVKQFEKAGRFALKITEKRNTMPVLSHFLIDAGLKGISCEEQYLTSTDLETYIKVDISGLIAVEESGSVLIPARNFLDLLKSKKGSLEISVPEEEKNIWLQVGSVRMAGISWKEFPNLPNWAEPNHKIERIGTIPGLADKLKHISYAAGVSDTRYTLNGIYFDLNKGKLVATDGHRMTIADTKKGKHSFILPIKAIKIIESIKADPEITVTFEKVKKKKGKGKAIEYKYAIFQYPGIQVYVRIIEGIYPNYEVVIPDFTDYSSITLNRTALIEKLEAVTVISPHIQIYFRDDSMVLYARNPDIGDARETLPYERMTEVNEDGFGINAVFLIQTLKAMDSERATLKFKGPLSPVTIFSHESSEARKVADELSGQAGDNLKFEGVIMPMRLGNYAESDKPKEEPKPEETEETEEETVKEAA